MSRRKYSRVLKLVYLTDQNRKNTIRDAYARQKWEDGKRVISTL